ncbi:MAG: isocitrate dehydrogenase (NAD(+)) [Ardenticatenaceae bacterium]|nr:isocitrate dehydrogenase (NAD(+)) [Ardenticatenaceae bacterium]HBY97797.1 isocitrate dehydrogenase (NAD(+)) [Chloroflexota bacterium]
MGGPYRVTLIPGDGIGPEVTAAARRMIDATGVQIDWQVHEAGGDSIGRYGTVLPQATIDSIIRNRVALKGPISTPIGSGFRSANVQLRQVLDLYANVRPVRTMPGVETRYREVNLVVVRENTEGLYSGIEHIVVPGVVESLKIITEKGSTRIAKYAFELARREGRKKVTAVHKANIMKLSDGLFLECARRLARDYPEIEYDEVIVDALSMRLVLDPTQFDVLVMENLYGDIISDLAAGLVGGLGLTPSGNIGERAAVFEAVHGSAPDIAGKGVANPTAVTLAGVMMLRHLGELTAADRVERAIGRVLEEGTHCTRDLGGTASTREFADAVIAAMDNASG